MKLYSTLNFNKKIKNWIFNFNNNKHWNSNTKDWNLDRFYWIDFLLKFSLYNQ